MSTIETLNMF